jgi:hypothetical protein
VTPSREPPGIPHRPGADALPPAAPHSVPAYARSRWPAGLARLWRAVFPRDAFARPTHVAGFGPDGGGFFPHGSEAAGDGPTPAPPPDAGAPARET